jgi:hypothetical protein
MLKNKRRKDNESMSVKSSNFELSNEKENKNKSANNTEKEIKNKSTPRKK